MSAQTTGSSKTFRKVYPQQKHEIVEDLATGLQWQVEVPDTRYTFNECADVARSCRLGGHNDWRLPTRAELATLIDDTRFNPAIDSEYFPGAQAREFWTSTTCAGSPGLKWTQSFSCGNSYGAPQSNRYWLRLVRGPLHSAATSQPAAVAELIAAGSALASAKARLNRGEISHDECSAAWERHSAALARVGGAA